MSELILKFNRLSAFHQQEVLDFVNFLLTKEHQNIQKTATQEVATDESYNFFESAGLMENRYSDAINKYVIQFLSNFMT